MANNVPTQKVPKTKVQVLRAIDIVGPVETGTNKPTDNERSKKKITKALYKSL